MTPAHTADQPRIEGVLKATGTARFEGEIACGDALHAALVVAPLAHGKVIAIDTLRAATTPGFVTVLTHDNAPRQRNAGFLNLLHDATVHFAGQPVALVLAESATAARQAAACVNVSYEPLPAITGLQQGAEFALAPREAGRVPTDSRRGDPEAALAVAEVRIERSYTTSVNNHHPMEPHVVLARWEGDRVVVHTATQAIFATRRVIAHCMAVPMDHVRVLSRYLGGGFGAKGPAWWPCMMLAIAVARQLQRPVRLELSRDQMFTLVGRRQETEQRLTMAARRDGTLTAIIHDTLSSTSPFADYADPTGALSRWLYACPNVATSHRLVRTNAPHPVPMRAPGEGPGSFALESAMDELAHELDVDPLQLRLVNFAEHDPHHGRPWSSNGLRECYRVAAQRFGWQRRPRAIGTWQEGRTRIGWGMASAAYPVYRMASEASVRLCRDGRVRVRCGTQDMGSGSCTVLAQIAAAELGVEVMQVDVELGDTALPEGPYSGGTIATASFTPAVQEAARRLRQMLFDLAAGRSDLTGPDHRARLPPEGLEAHARVAPEDTGTVTPMGYGAVFAEVRVDRQLGEIRVARLSAAYAAGRILNPLLARSQHVGALIGGIGMALHEVTLTDTQLGRIVNNNLGDYLVPVHADMPAFDVQLVDEEDPHLAGGIKGIGMLGTVGTAAAIANAVFHATGVRVRRLPIRIEDVLS